MATRIPALIQLSDPRVAAQLVQYYDGSGLFVRVEVCVWVSDPRFIRFALGSCYAVHINALSMKVYIKMNNIQVELIRFRKKWRLY